MRTSHDRNQITYHSISEGCSSLTMSNMAVLGRDLHGRALGCDRADNVSGGLQPPPLPPGAAGRPQPLPGRGRTGCRCGQRPGPPPPLTPPPGQPPEPPLNGRRKGSISLSFVHPFQNPLSFNTLRNAAVGRSVKAKIHSGVALKGNNKQITAHL